MKYLRNVFIGFLAVIFAALLIPILFGAASWTILLLVPAIGLFLVVIGFIWNINWLSHAIWDLTWSKENHLRAFMNY